MIGTLELLWEDRSPLNYYRMRRLNLNCFAPDYSIDWYQCDREDYTANYTVLGYRIICVEYWSFHWWGLSFSKKNYFSLVKSKNSKVAGVFVTYINHIKMGNFLHNFKMSLMLRSHLLVFKYFRENRFCGIYALYLYSIIFKHIVNPYCKQPGKSKAQIMGYYQFIMAATICMIYSIEPISYLEIDD